jgi:hypothetical protein
MNSQIQDSVIKTIQSLDQELRDISLKVKENKKYKKANINERGLMIAETDS